MALIFLIDIILLCRKLRYPWRVIALCSNMIVSRWRHGRFIIELFGMFEEETGELKFLSRAVLILGSVNMFYLIGVSLSLMLPFFLPFSCSSYLFHRILAFACPTSLPFLSCNASRPLSLFLLPTFYSIFRTPHHPLISSWKLSWCFSPPSSSPASNYQTRFYLCLSHILSSSLCAFTMPRLTFTVSLPVS